MADTEVQQLVRDAITSLAFGVEPRDALIRIAKGVGIRVEQDDEGHAFTLPSDTIWIGDTVKLTGLTWAEFGLQGRVMQITDISINGEPQFPDPGGPGFMVIYKSEEFDYSATLVSKGEPTA